MPSSGIAAATSDLKSRFLNGLAPPGPAPVTGTADVAYSMTTIQSPFFPSAVPLGIRA
jgi:hypothetical protein